MFFVKKLTLIFVLLFASAKGQNLVPNWSFETYTICPTASSQVTVAIPWLAPGSSSDYFNACASLYNVPDVPGAGFQAAKDGSAFSAIYYLNGLSSNYKEYIEIKLNDTLTGGKCYYAEF